MEFLLLGFFTGLSLILAIGAQNIFVIEQGLKKQHVFLVCLVCSLSDLLLIFSGPCWVEIYTDNEKPLIYKLYNKNEVLEIDIKKSFTLVIGNIDNVNVDYAGKNINLVDSANEQKVSTTTFKNE